MINSYLSSIHKENEYKSLPFVVERNQFQNMDIHVKRVKKNQYNVILLMNKCDMIKVDVGIQRLRS